MSNRPTTAQLETLVEFLELNTAIARGLIRTSQGKQETKKKWAELAIQLNALEGLRKDGPGWAKYWAEKKCNLKKMCAQHAASARQTGGGSGERFVLSELDTRLMAVTGGTNFASGDSGVAVNPLPQTQPAVESVFLLDINVIPSPPPPTAGTTSEEAPAVPTQTSVTTNPRRRPRRLLSRNVSTEMDGMEERRAKAERLSEEALVDTCRSLDNQTEAMEHIAQAISEVASALRLIANNFAQIT